MTLIAGFKCRDGYVISADSQETKGYFRVSRLKLSPWQASGFNIAMAGSGNNGELLDAFEQRLKDSLAGTQLQTLKALQEFIGHEILEFRKNEAQSYPKREQEMRFLIGAQSIVESQCALWRNSASRLRPVTDYAIVGFEDARYEYAAKNLYRPDATIAQGLFLSLYIMWLAEQTSNSVKSPVTVAILKNGGIFSQDPPAVDGLLARVKLFSAQFDSIFLACADTGLPESESAKKFKEFIETVLTLRRDYVVENVNEKIAQGIDTVVDFFSLIPVGTQIVINAGTPQAASIQKVQDGLIQSLRDREDGKQNPERIKSNLAALKLWRERLLRQVQGGEGLSAEEHAVGVRAFQENLESVEMGPYKTTQFVVNLLARVHSFLTMPSLGLGEHVDLQLQIMCLDQTHSYVENTFPAAPAQSPS
jgi:hypothetical protein